MRNSGTAPPALLGNGDRRRSDRLRSAQRPRLARRPGRLPSVLPRCADHSGQRPGPLYFPFRQRGVESCTDRVCPYVYPYSPLVALAVTPLAHWEKPTAAAVWFGINQLFTVLAFLALLLPWRHALTLPRLAVLLIVFANFAPVTRQHAVGNITSLQLLLAATALALLLDARDLVAGFALGLLVLIKPFWLLFFRSPHFWWRCSNGRCPPASSHAWRRPHLCSRARAFATPTCISSRSASWPSGWYRVGRCSRGLT